ncbi:hypothetical protein [Massilia sp. KIM]|uniref:hypothetical protein n=1 Tax=Massilia sp. KIM TaxID=1955422 RepID=UPI00117D0D8B|nr:hypothetical protein [Massilia sp. KIM]
MPKASIDYPSTIVDGNNNGGWHRNGKRAYRKAVQGILRFLQTAKEARLYHLCFEPLDDDTSSKTSAEMYKANMAMLHALRQMAERDGIRCEWWAAREVADSTKKDHLHTFMVIDAYGIKVAKLFNQFEDGRVQQHCKAHGVKFAIFNPKDYKGLHGRNTYMALPYQGPGNRETERGRKRLADALGWCSYLGKARSKPEDDKSGQIFPASRPNRKSKQSPSLAGSPAHQEERIEEEVVESAGEHVASKCEQAIDQQLDVTAVPVWNQSVQRTQAQVIHARTESKRPRRLPLPSGRLTTGRGTINIQGTI